MTLLQSAQVNIPDFLNKKFLSWQMSQGERKTLDDFAALLEVSRPLLSLWMNGSRVPSIKYKKRIIELFGKEAIEAFGEDPALYYLKENWDSFSPEKRRAILQQAEKPENETKRLHKRRRTSSS
jgi:transcriptional regulator with XRE-family HTH domain